MISAKKKIILGMDIIVFTNQSCQAEVAEGEDEHGKWATIYCIESQEEGKGHATELLKFLKKFYAKFNYRFGGSVALNPKMAHLYKKLKIPEYDTLI